MEADGFKASRGSALLVHSSGNFTPRRVIVAGLGKKEDLDLDAIRQASAAAARTATSCSTKAVTYVLPPATGRVERVGERARAVAEGFLHGTYRLRKYFTGSNKTKGSSLRSAELIVSAADLNATRAAVGEAAATAYATNIARDLVNEPAGSLTPVIMAEYASRLAERAGLHCTVYDRKGLEKLGMGAFLGVAQGSVQPPRFIHLIYKPKGKPSRKVALVGKGLTFDSGGLSLKSSAGMETMKMDKGGAAAVLGTMVGLKDLKPQVEVHGLLGMAENMPSGSAIKPGDILKTCGGKTIEVLNTDAEGRLVLADLLCHVRTLGVDEVIDLATLTGACVVALGPFSTGVFSQHDDFSRALLAAAEKAGERMWPMPIYDEYMNQLRSEIADVKNTGERWGGAITAALFLREFIGRRIPWAHMDIAGPAFLDTNSHPYLRKGGTGAGVRTLLAYLASLS